jgi:futalosine hydrolase
MRILIMTAVDAEARAIGVMNDAKVLVGGIGRTNAAAAATEAILKQQHKIDAVISAGVGGALPGSKLSPGDSIVASRCIYLEEGILTPHGFTDMRGLGFSLGDFEGNAVPVDERLLDVLGAIFPIGPIATVATCSGTDESAAEVVRRTGALAEAMEGAAVVHAARRLGVPAIEIRAISNFAGDRANQQWDFARGLQALGESVQAAVKALQKS